MTFAQHARRQTAWIAFLAVLLASLLPYVQLAQRAGADGFPLAQICTVAGAKLLPAGAPGLPADHHAQHCSLCWTPAGGGLPPTGPLLPAATGFARAAATPERAATPTGAAWSPAQPRAPPGFPFSAV